MTRQTHDIWYSRVKYNRSIDENLILLQQNLADNNRQTRANNVANYNRLPTIPLGALGLKISISPDKTS